MKKIVALILILAIGISILGCSPKSEKEPENSLPNGFLVGYGRGCTTPQENVPLGGFGTSKTRIMNHVLDDIFATAIAMTDEGGKTVLLICVDMQRIADDLIALYREMVSTATGVPEDKIIITCSHTHSIPDLTYTSHEGIKRYIIYLGEQMAAAAAQALADRAPATMYTGTIDCPGLNFVKHYEAVDDDGVTQHFGDNFGEQLLNETTHHVTEAYNKMLLMKFVREGKKDIVISNFRSHPTLTGGADERNLSADFVGPWRDAVEEELDCHFAFIQGAAGNINPTSRISAENVIPDKNYREYAARLTEKTLEGVRSNMKETPTGTLQCEKISFEATVDHSDDYLLSQVSKVIEYRNAGNSVAKTTTYSRTLGFSSYYHATSVQFTSAMGEKQAIELDVFSIGDQIGFFTIPGEVFDLMSVEMEQESPFPMTITVGYADGDWKYFPYGPCAEYNSYESDYGRFAKNTAAEMKSVWLDHLNQQFRAVAK